MFDSDTTVTTYGFGHHLWHAILALFLGPVFLLGAAILIFWNEKHTIKVANTLAEGAATFIEANGAEVDPSLDGKLVHLSRDLRPEGTLRDPKFGVKASGLRLKRKVEVYQWSESRRSEKRNGTTTYYYSYRTGWDESLHSSSGFEHRLGHENPSTVAYATEEYSPSLVRMGAYQLDPSLAVQIKDSRPLALTAADVQLPTGARLTANGQIYLGADPQSPRVGDLRVTEQLVPAGAASVVAGITNGQLVAFHGKSGGEIALVRSGSLDAATMFAAARASNSSLAWVWRGLGLLGLFLGLQCILGPLATLASFVPVLGTLFEEGVAIFSLLGAGVIWSVLVAVSWLAARPLLGSGLLVFALLGVGLFVAKAVRRSAASQARGMAGTPPMGGGMPPVANVR